VVLWDPTPHLQHRGPLLDLAGHRLDTLRFGSFVRVAGQVAGAPGHLDIGALTPVARVLGCKEGTILGVYGRVQIDGERYDEQAEKEANHPLDGCADMEVAHVGRGGESHRQGDGKADKDDLGPEGDLEDAVPRVS